MSTDPQRSFWANVLRAVEAEPREASSIRGASGIQHPVIAVGLDEERRRLIVVSGEHDARTAAMAQIDIQASLQGIQVVVARPIALDLTILAKTLACLLGKTTITSDELQKMMSKPGDVPSVLDQGLRAVLAPLDYVSNIPMNVLAQLMHGIQQLGLINLSPSSEAVVKETRGSSADLGRLAELDPLERDNHYGVCPVPLYEFQASEVETLNSGAGLDNVREILRRHHLIQYFSPAPDQLALGLVDRGAGSVRTLLDQLALSPEMGHPFASSEILENQGSLPEVVDALQERNLVVEGEVGLEVGPEGRRVRASVRFKAREGLLSKIINRFSFSFDLKSLLGSK